jgi:hypothetical protein
LSTINFRVTKNLENLEEERSIKFEKFLEIYEKEEFINENEINDKFFLTHVPELRFDP